MPRKARLYLPGTACRALRGPTPPGVRGKILGTDYAKGCRGVVAFA